MDEILASIKKIIADEDRAKPAAKRSSRAAKNQNESEQDDTVGVSPLESSDDREILELTETAEEEAQDAPVAAGTEGLLDDGSAQSLRHSFSVLQTLAEPGVRPQIVRSGETSLEELTRDLMRPMLKDWLDAHLPVIVESMVAREIARITKKS